MKNPSSRKKRDARGLATFLTFCVRDVYDVIKAWVVMFAIVVAVLLGVAFLHQVKMFLLPPYYGEVLITSQVDGLSIIINEKKVGTTQKGETFKYKFREETGGGIWGRQRVVFHKDIDAESEYFLELDLHVGDEQIEKKEVKRIHVIAPDYDYIKNKDYEIFYQRIEIRTKRNVLRKQTGVLKEVKLKHNSSLTMIKDGKSLYVISRASTNVYSESEREDQDREFLEIYDLETLTLLDEIPLGFNDDTFTKFISIALNDDFIYVGTHEPDPYVAASPRTDMFRSGPGKKLETIGYKGSVTGLRTYKDYLFSFDFGGNAAVYKNNTLLYTIQTKPLSMDKYKKLEDKRFGALFDLLVHDGIIYISNDNETVYMYKLNDEKPMLLGGFDRIHLNESNGTYNVSDIQAMLMYQDRYLLFATEYMGLSCYDTKNKRMVYEHKNLYPKSSFYSEMFKEEVDDTRSTDIYKMLLYKHYLIFTEVADHIVVYDMNKNKIVHTFAGASDDIFDLEVYKDQLISLSSDGMLYVWDLLVLGR